MKMQELREIAKKRGIKTANMKKVDIIRNIQREEGNSDCYCSGSADKCDQTKCLWKDDCE
ncbi:MAG TPA: SAP domain-containing protein [Geobacteraceae bacterium]|nr:SAP domain-containing protein [Geobacteraceae bacterium]